MPRRSSSAVPTTLMADSGQTDTERRQLRHKQRLLQKTIVEQTEALEDANDGVFGQVRDDNNALFSQVRYTREAVLDGENLDLLAARAARQIDKLIERAQYDAVRLTKKLRDKCSVGAGQQQQFDWKALGVEAGACFNAVPSRVQFLNGPLQADYAPKERAKRQKHAAVEEEEAEEEEPEDVKAMGRNADQLSAVERSMKVIGKVLKKRCRDTLAENKASVEALAPEEREAAKKRLKQEGGAGSVDAIPFLMNPRSFTQSVENIFHFSFLVKGAKAQIKVKDGRPVVSEDPKRSEEFQPPARQAIVALTMKDWRDMCDAYGLRKGDIPNRSGSRHGGRAREVTPSP